MSERPSTTPDVSTRMAKQRRSGTEPELALRRLMHSRGLRFRVQFPVPGRARNSIDIAFTRARVAVFVDGCFWHRCPLHRSEPVSNAGWWKAKLDANEARDRATDEYLRELGWEVVRCWEHESPEECFGRVAGVLRKRVGDS